MKRVIYFFPFSDSGLKNKLFEPYSNPKANVPPFDYLKRYLNEHGIEAKTIDLCDNGKSDDQDLLIVFDHPPVGIYKWLYLFRDLIRRKNTFPLKNRHILSILPKFKRKVLMQWESAVNNPWVYKNIPSITSLYDKSYFIPKASGFPHFYYPQNFNRLNNEHFNKPRTKFMVMMNSFTKAKGFLKHELYSHRVKALEFFGQHSEVDLYGPRWDKHPSPVVKKIWKGFADDKPATMAEYSFALCFENATWPGYVTEKIFDCLLVGTIPVYWGAPDIEDDVPASCFVDMRKFKNFEELRIFLHSLSPADVKRYKESISTYFESSNFKKFTPEHFGETLMRVIQDQAI